MEPSEGTHPDPVGQASAAAGQKIAEFAAVAAMLLQTAVLARARQAAGAAGGLAQQDVDFAAARTAWSPALHREWLADASLRDVARAWGAAAPWEGADQGAAAALSACEIRLRELHPYAMRRYDELRARGWGRTHAMAEAAPGFAMHPSPRPAPEDINEGRYVAAAAAAPDTGDVAADPEPAITQRILRTLARLNEQEIAAGCGPLTSEAAGIALRTRLNAPDSLIGAIVNGLREGTLTVPAAAAAPARRTVSDSGPVALDWPADARAAVTAGTAARAGAAGQRAARRPALLTPDLGQQPRLHP
jgi:hypothetical protein